MNIQEAWQKAVKQTEILRPRVEPLSRISITCLPYIFLAESAVNPGDTVVRKGEITVEKPAIILPSNIPRFEGFEENESSPWQEQAVSQFFLVRGVRFPSFHFNNTTHSIDIREGSLSDASRHYLHELQRQENTSSGLILGPEDCWQFSILIFTGEQSLRQAEGDMKSLWDGFLRGEGRS